MKRNIDGVNNRNIIGIIISVVICLTVTTSAFAALPTYGSVIDGRWVIAIDGTELLSLSAVPSVNRSVKVDTDNYYISLSDGQTEVVREELIIPVGTEINYHTGPEPMMDAWFYVTRLYPHPTSPADALDYYVDHIQIDEDTWESDPMFEFDVDDGTPSGDSYVFNEVGLYGILASYADYSYYDNREKANKPAHLAADEVKYADNSSVPLADYFVVNVGGVTESAPKPTQRAIAAEPVEPGIKISWTPEKNASDIVGYNIYRSDKQGEKGEKLNREILTSHEYVDINVRADSSYYYSVYAVAADNSEVQLVISESENVSVEDSVDAGDGVKDGAVMVSTAPVILGSELGDRRGYILMQIDKDTMLVNDRVVDIDSGRGTAPVISKDRTLVPIRTIIETIGGRVEWDEREKKVTIALADKELEMWLEKTEMLVDGQPVENDVAPTTINDRTMLPIRFVAENLNCKISWLGATNEIIIVWEMS